MPDIRIHRDHALGLARARKVALRWAEDAEQRLDMACTILEGELSDTVEFTRTGVRGTLLVEAHRFTLEARLGLLLGAFAKTIEAEIGKNLDTLLGAGPAGKADKVAKASKAMAPAQTAKPAKHAKPKK